MVLFSWLRLQSKHTAWYVGAVQLTTLREESCEKQAVEASGRHLES